MNTKNRCVKFSRVDSPLEIYTFMLYKFEGFPFFKSGISDSNSSFNCLLILRESVISITDHVFLSTYPSENRRVCLHAVIIKIIIPEIMYLKNK